MTITPPTLEQFMAQRDQEEVDVPAAEAPDPLSSIADSLRVLVDMAQSSVEEERTSDSLRELHDDLDAKHAVLYDLVLEIEAIIKPSTSKLANTVREAIGRWRGVEPEATSDPEPEPVVEEPGAVGGPPHKDADVEAWRAYAATQVSEDVSQLNRSQIRTLLGIPHES